MIEIKNITKTYGEGKTAFTALRNLTFSIPSSTTIAIVGRSGSGKSTLMHLISGLDRPTKGEVIIDGQNIFDWPETKIDQFRASTMSFVFQSFFIQGSETCANNVGLPLEINGIKEPARTTAINHALKSVSLYDKKTELAKNLSGGQKQRLAIARAIASQPKILFADEPTGNLDTATGTQIENLLFAYSQTHAATLFIVTHDHALASKCDHEITLLDGEIKSITKNSPNKGSSK